ncbi:MAG: hypothetical protein M1837_005989 [Sclerophora amabilis]|nr:MAG: hypothetical protein M1837_005989 [Sclerophora amabilis]
MAHPFPGSNIAVEPATQILTTTFLIPNLHCPSCVSGIHSSLALLDPRPLSISHSIVSHLITVQHSTSLTATAISTALETAGFEVYGVFSNAPSPSGLPGAELDDHFGPDWTQRFAKKIDQWSSNTANVEIEYSARTKRHLDLCEQCRNEVKEKDLPSSTVSGSPLIEDKSQSEKIGQSQKNEASNEASNRVLGAEVDVSSGPFVVIDSPTKPDALQASFMVGGMTCSSCVGTISRALDQKPWISSADVSLLTNSVSVTFQNEEHLKDIIEVIEDVGYEVTFEQMRTVNSNPRSTRISTGRKWQVLCAVIGMGSTSCGRKIREALELHDWVTNAEVDVNSNRASVVFFGQDHLVQIKTIIEEVGYEVVIDSLKEINSEISKDSQRKVALRVDGIYCSHCPSRIADALEQEWGTKIQIKKLPTVYDPILEIAYVAQAPDFTIRHILASLSAIDSKLRLSIHHPPTLEESSRKMQVRERRHVLFRLCLSLLAAIPTLVIGVVLMNLVSSTNPVRQFIMQPMWAGQVTRAEWALFISATPVYFLAADAFHRPALRELWALWRPGSKTPILQRFYRFGSMNMLMSLGTSIAYFSSIAELAISATRPRMSMSMSMETSSSYFDSVVFLTMFLLVGRFLEAYSKAKAGDAVTLLGKLRPTEAILIGSSHRGLTEAQADLSGEVLRHIAVDLLEAGDMVKILHGASPPSDGIIVEGATRFDESSLTGESRLVEKSIGDQVFAGTFNKAGPISMCISSLAGTSMLDQIVKVVREGQTRRAPIERVADMITSHFVPLVVLFAISTWIIWLSLGLSGTLPEDYLNITTGSWPLWSLQFAIAAFVVACPCGIGLAAPTALFVGGGLAARHGILANGGGEAFQEASGLDCIVFDKTGTLTEGTEPAITDYAFLSDGDERRMLGIVKSLEENSTHPVAKALVSFCNSKAVTSIPVHQVEEVTGKGMKGRFASDDIEAEATQVIVGNEAFLADYGVEMASDSDVSRNLNTWKAEGKSIALLAVCTTPGRSPTTKPNEKSSKRWRLLAAFATSDPVRPDAAAVVRAIQRKGIQVWMISGDNVTTARAVGQMVGISSDHIIAGVLPDQKAEQIKYLQRSLTKDPKNGSCFGLNRSAVPRRAIAAMVGDGINDSPALTVADVGIAIGSGSDVAISCAEFILISSNLSSLLTLIDLSRAVFRRVKFNFLWALVYNLLALPVAAGVLYPLKGNNGQHVRLDPVWASLAMALSSLSVVCSSLLLKSRMPLVGFRHAGVPPNGS